MSEFIQAQLGKLYAPAVIQRLANLDTKEQNPIAVWLIQNPVGTNYALEILGFLIDLAKKEDSRISTLLTEILQRIPKKENHPKDLGRVLRDGLHRRLHPHSTEHQDRFETLRRALKLPKEIFLKAPKNFEGNGFSLEINFENIEALEGNLKFLLNSLKEAKQWKELEAL